MKIKIEVYCLQCGKDYKVTYIKMDEHTVALTIEVDTHICKEE